MANLQNPHVDPTPLTHRVLTSLSAGADIENRRLYLVGDIDSDTAGRLLVSLDVLNQHKGPIALFMSSPGGSVSAAFAIYDAIKISPNPVSIVCFGEVMSAATLILQAAHERLMTPNTRYMIHNMWQEVGGAWDGEDFSKASKELSKLMDMYANALADRSKLTAKEIKKLCGKETFWSAEETLQHGLIDGIVTQLLPMAPHKHKHKKSKKKASKKKVQRKKR